MPSEANRSTERTPSSFRGKPRRRPSGGPAGSGPRGPKRRPSRPPMSNPDAPPVDASGVLELHPQSYGFLRNPERDFRPSDTDIFVPAALIARYGMRPGNLVQGLARQLRPGEGARLEEVFDVDGLPPEQYAEVRSFDELTPINPERYLKLETGNEPLTTRVIDLLTPLGMGQRALIVAPPRTGKTVLLQHIGKAVGQNFPDINLMVLLVDERPEEVTEMRRQIPGQVLASSLDQEVESHVRLSQLAVERSKRIAERGGDVVLMVDSITRLARAFNKRMGNTGRTMSGGMDVKALDIPKKLFATARAFEEGGSLTIVATALIDTGSRMDEVIFQEFKGTGNMELVLDRQLADRRVWPAIDISQSGTRREEKLLDEETLRATTALRRTLSSMNPIDAMQQLTTQLAKTSGNEEFIQRIASVRAA